MVVFIIISILVHIFTIFALLVLYQRGTDSSSPSALQTEDVAGLQQSLQSYITEIERENEAFYERINHLVTEKLLHMEDKLQELEKKIDNLESRFAGEEVSQIDTNETLEHKPEAIKDNILPEMKQVLELSRQGFNVEQISKSLQMGKGEVSLMLNLLHKQGLKK